MTDRSVKCADCGVYGHRAIECAKFRDLRPDDTRELVRKLCRVTHTLAGAIHKLANGQIEMKRQVSRQHEATRALVSRGITLIQRNRFES